MGRKATQRQEAGKGCWQRTELRQRKAEEKEDKLTETTRALQRNVNPIPQVLETQRVSSKGPENGCTH